MIRLPHLLSLGALALLTAACGTGTTEAPRAAPTSAAPSAAPTATGFPTDQDGPVLDAARLFTQRITTYDDEKLADQRNAVLPLTAAPLRDELGKQLADDGEFATAVRNDARDATGTVVDLGLVSREGNRAVVLVFVDQAVTSSAGEQTQRLRERVTLTRNAAGAWLATKLETL